MNSSALSICFTPIRCGLFGLFLLNSLFVPAHELTRSNYEASLDSREKLLLAQARGLTTAAEPPSASRTCQLTIRLIDAKTREPLPGLVRLLRENASAVSLPGLVNRGLKLRENHPAKAWHAFVGAQAVPVPREKLVLEAISGLDTELARVHLDLTGKTAAEVSLPLNSFDDAGGRGWFTGNTHLHLSGLSRDQADEYLRVIPRADRLDLVFVSYLERVKADRDYISNGYTLGELQQLGGPDLLFGNGQEHRHNFEGFGEGYGHVMLLNIQDLVRPVSIGAGIMGEGPDWPPLRRGIGQARGAGATVIWCHNTFGLEDIPNWLSELLHAQNIFDGGAHGSYEDTFYRYLNIGLQVPFSTGTDWFIYDFSRVYAKLSAAPSVQSWLEALRAGRTFISNGPLLEFRAGTHEIGDTVRLAQAGNLAIAGQAKARHDFHQIELIHNGQVIHRAPSRAVGNHFEAQLDFSLPVNEPGWMALRVPGGSLEASGAVVVPPNTPVRSSDGGKNEMGEALFAHTSPIYIELGGRRIFKRETAQVMLSDVESALRSIPSKANFDNKDQRQEILRIYEQAADSLRRRLSQ